MFGSSPGKVGLGMGRPGFSPSKLFALGEVGAWYDPSDLSTMFTDIAGTTPVATPGTVADQTVGKILDKSGRSNHATAPSDAARPLLSARVNLLTKTEDFADAVWTKTGGATAPSTGVITAIAGDTGAYQSASNIAGTYVTVFEVKYIDVDDIAISIVNVLDAITYKFSTQAIGGLDAAQATATVLPDGYVRISFYHTVASAGNFGPYLKLVNAGSVNARNASFKISLTNDITYQRVNTASDYTGAFQTYNLSDGVDDSTSTAAGGGATSAFFFCQSIQMGKVGAVQVLFSDAGANTGYEVGIDATNHFYLSAGNGAARVTATTAGTLAVGQIAVLTAHHNGATLSVQIDNGTAATTAFVTATAGTAVITMNQTNGAATNFFLGKVYETVYVKDNVQTAAEIASTKTWVGKKAGMTV